MKDGRAGFVPVKTGAADELHVEVESGIDVAAGIVTGPYRTLKTLKDGERVRWEAKPIGKKTAAPPPAAADESTTLAPATTSTGGG